MTDYEWKMYPIVGECSSNGAVIVYEGNFPKGLTIKVEKIIPNSMYSNIKNIKDWIVAEEVYTEILRDKGKGEFYSRFWLDITNIYNYGENNPTIPVRIKWYHGHELDFPIYTNQFFSFDNPDSILVMSCDFEEARLKSKDSMWKVMEKELISPCLALHLGDQVYMDEETNRCFQLCEDEQNSLKALQVLKNRYFSTFKSHHEILSSMSNIGINDDHEFYNDDYLNLHTKLENYIETIKVPEYEGYDIVYNSEIEPMVLCEHAYDLYQGLLHARNPSGYSWCKRYETGPNHLPTLLIALERFEKYNGNKLMSVLTDNQDVKRLIIGYTSFPLFKPTSRMGSLYLNLIGSGKFWDQDELHTFYDQLFEWMGKDQEKEIVVLGGDVHCGMYGTITSKSNNRNIKFMVSSPITNQPTWDRSILTKAMKGEHQTDDYIMNIIKAKDKRCYGKLVLDKDKMDVEMTFSDKMLPKHPIDYVMKLNNMKKSNTKMSKRRF
jgi:hypothetical protein